MGQKYANAFMRNLLSKEALPGMGGASLYRYLYCENRIMLNILYDRKGYSLIKDESINTYGSRIYN